MVFAQIVMGPAGSGKSTYCHNMVLHGIDIRRSIKVINLDPAAETFSYEPLVDIKELIQLADVMEDEQLRYGPNGGLIFCMEFLLENSDWLRKQILGSAEEDDTEGHDGIDEEDYILFDCPGQIELYTHMTVMRQLMELLESWNVRVCGVFLLDSHFMLQTSKFFSGTLMALSVMSNLEIPQINVLSKMDLLSKSSKDKVERFLEADTEMLLEDEKNETVNSKWHAKYFKMSKAICDIIDNYSIVSYMPLNFQDDDSIQDLLTAIDTNLQYGEGLDIRGHDFEQPDEGFNE